MAERRPDPTNPKGSKKTYTREQFVDFYGKKYGAKMWKDAAPAGPAERRKDPTNPPEAKKTYTRDQFIEFYGKADGAKMWKQAGKAAPAPKKSDKKAKKDKPKKKKEAAKPKEKKEIVVGYWAIRGLAAPLRMMCHYRGANMKEVGYETGDKWFGEDKPALAEKNPLMNLPYVQIGETLVTQSNACMQFLGTRLGIDRGDPTLNNQLLCEIMDLRNAVIGIVYPFSGVTKDGFKDALVKHLDTAVGKHYPKLNSFVKGDYLTGKKPRSADFHLWEMLDQHELMAAEFGQESPLAKYDKLKAIYENIKKLPALEKYFASDAYKLPVNNPMAANWTGPKPAA